MTPLISIIIPAFNVQDYIVEAVDSAMAQTVQDIEIIIVDDHSTDQTVDKIAPFLSDRRVRLLTNDSSHAGPSGARNTGLRVARGKYIGFLDGDDRWHPGKAHRHIAAMQRQPRLDLTFSQWATMTESGALTGRVTKPPLKHRFSVEDLLKDNLVGGTSNVVCRTSAIERAGLFDESLKAAVDLDLYLRIALLGDDNIGFLDGLLTFYRLREGQITKDWKRMAANWELVVSKVRTRIPDRVARVEKEARAKHLRYRAYLAYEARDFAACRRLSVQAVTSWSLPLFADRRTWITLAAALGSMMPNPLHRKLASCAQKLRSALAGAL